jgi:hypothetical protein
MHSSPTARLARAWAQARSRLCELCGDLAFSVMRSREPAVRVAVVKTSGARSRSVRGSGHPAVIERRSP